MKNSDVPVRFGTALLGLWLLAPPWAQAARDPMEPPSAPAAPRPAADGTMVVAGAATAAPASPALPAVRHIVSVAGQHFVVVGARRHGPGDRLGELRIECVHATGVVARDEAGVRRHLPLYGAVAVRPAAAEGEVPVAAATPVVPLVAPAGCSEPESKTPKRKSP